MTWWKEWWARSRIATGDAELDRFYCGQVYLLGAGVRANKFPPGPYGIWVTTDNAKWHNDFHLNYNYVGTYSGVACPRKDGELLPEAVREGRIGRVTRPARPQCARLPPQRVGLA